MYDDRFVHRGGKRAKAKGQTGRLVLAACFSLALLALTIVSLPLKSFNLHASDTDLKNVTVSDDGRLRPYKTGARNVQAFLTEQGIPLHPKDACDRHMRESLIDGMRITIRRGLDVSVQIDGIRKTHRVAPGTSIDRFMAALQDEYHTALLYYGDISREITAGESLVFASWRSHVLTYSLALPFATEEYETADVSMGAVLTRQEGISGEKQITESVIYIGGVETQREVLRETVVREPVLRVLDIGIGGRLGTITDTASPDFRYKKKLTMHATAYTAGYESTGKRPGDRGYGITKSGLPVEHGIVAVDPKVIPLGTRLYVEGYGYALAADIGSAIKGSRIDLYYERLEDAIRFGRRNLDVYILG